MLNRSQRIFGRGAIRALMAVTLLFPLSATSAAPACNECSPSLAPSAASGSLHSRHLSERSPRVWPEKSLRFNRADAGMPDVLALPRTTVGVSEEPIVQHVIDSSWDVRDERGSSALGARLHC